MIAIVCFGGEAQLTGAEKELIGAARHMASSSELETTLVAVGANAEAVASAAGAYGIDRGVAVVGELDEYGAEGYVDNLARVLAELSPEAVLMTGDPLPREVGPRLAVRLQGAALNDVAEIRHEDDRFVWTRPVFGAKALADVVLKRKPAVCVVQQGAFEAAGGDAQVETAVSVHAAEPPETSVRVLEQTSGDGEGELRMEDADIVVAGGRGIGDAEGFDLLKQLADELGGALGASLAAVDEGWAPHELQIGQTGKIISPELYIAAGISGASQHIFGVGGAKTIIAINTDGDAPIFEAAHLGVVMDYKQLLPALVRALQEA